MKRFVTDEIARQYPSRKHFLAAHRITESTFYRVMQDSPDIGEDQYRRIEGALDLPRLTLDYIANEDLDSLQATDLSADQVRVIDQYLVDVRQDRAFAQARQQQDARDERLQQTTKRSKPA